MKFSKADVAAIKATYKGEATADQQARALNWIIKQAAGIADDPFDPKNARVTDYNLGRRAVGLAVARLIEMPSAAMEKVPNE